MVHSSKLISELGLNRQTLGADFEDKIEYTAFGPVVTDPTKIELLAAQNTRAGLSRGKLVVPRSLEEVREQDGKDGRQKWVYWGSKVYDVTGIFPAISTIGLSSSCY
jgi:hypothetical protein